MWAKRARRDRHPERIRHQERPERYEYALTGKRCKLLVVLIALMQGPIGQTSAEGEHVGLDSGLEERDLERVLLDAAVLTDELVEPRLGNNAVALLVVDVSSV